MAKTDNGDGKDVKKTVTSRVGLASKATAQNGGGVQKITRNNSSRSALATRDVNKKETTETKRPAGGSGPGIGGGVQTKRQPAQKSSIQTENEAISEEPPRKKVDIERKVTVEEPVLDEDIPDDLDEGFVAEGVVDLDAEDLYDPLMAADYVVGIFDYLKELEPTTMPNPDYMHHQDELEWKMRGILVDWLIEVHTRFRLLPETLFLAVNIIDRFLSSEVVSLDRLQLVGVTAMFIASKYEEVLSPHVANFSHVADETFSDKEILDAERHILATINYDISYPSPMNFLRRISKADNYDVHTRTLAKYLMEISLLEHRLMQYRQSHIAAASMYLARLVLDRGCWVSHLSRKSCLLPRVKVLTLYIQDATLAHYAGYTKEEILPVFHLMVDYLHRPVAHEAFFKKYASKKFMKGRLDHC